MYPGPLGAIKKDLTFPPFSSRLQITAGVHLDTNGGGVGVDVYRLSLNMEQLF